MPLQTEYAMTSWGGAGVQGMGTWCVPALIVFFQAFLQLCVPEVLPWRRARLERVCGASRWLDDFRERRNAAFELRSGFPVRSGGKGRDRWPIPHRIFQSEASPDETSRGPVRLRP